MKVVVLAPIKNSLHSRLAMHLLNQAEGIEVCLVVVRTPWTLSRIRGELRRDGLRLLRKAYRKIVVGESVYEGVSDTIVTLAKEAGLPGRDIYELGRETGIPVLTVREHNDEQSCKAIAGVAPDLVVFTGGGLIRKQLLSIPRLGVLNCHMGPLPNYRGMDVVEWPLLELGSGEAKIGITTHYMDCGVDTGDILIEREVDYADLKSFRAIRDRMEPLMVKQMADTVFAIRTGAVERKSQAVSDGRQYFVLHPRLYEVAEGRL